MISLIPILWLCGAVAHAAPGPLTGPSARATAAPTVRTLGQGVVVDRVVDGVIVGHRGAAPLAWTWQGRTFINTAPPTAPAAVPPTPGTPAAPDNNVLSCGEGVTATMLPSAAEGWTAGLCPGGQVALRRDHAGHAVSAVVSVLDGLPLAGARALDPGDGAFGLLVWGDGGLTRAVAWRPQELVPAAWRAAWMPAGPPLDWPQPATANPSLAPAVSLDLTMPVGAVVTDAFVYDGRLTLVGAIGQGRAAQAAVFDTPWIPVLAR